MGEVAAKPTEGAGPRSPYCESAGSHAPLRRLRRHLPLKQGEDKGISAAPASGRAGRRAIGSGGPGRRQRGNRRGRGSGCRTAGGCIVQRVVQCGFVVGGEFRQAEQEEPGVPAHPPQQDAADQGRRRSGRRAPNASPWPTRAGRPRSAAGRRRPSVARQMMRAAIRATRITPTVRCNDRIGTRGAPRGAQSIILAMHHCATTSSAVSQWNDDRGTVVACGLAASTGCTGLSPFVQGRPSACHPARWPRRALAVRRPLEPVGDVVGMLGKPGRLCCLDRRRRSGLRCGTGNTGGRIR